MKRWRYKPFNLDGKPVKNKVDITLEFKLPSEIMLRAEKELSFSTPPKTTTRKRLFPIHWNTSGGIRRCASQAWVTRSLQRP